MSFSRYLALLLLPGSLLAAGNGFMIGGGVESDSDDSLGVSLIGSVGLAENTWLSAGAAKSSIKISRGREIKPVYADVQLDHFFDPVGVRIGAAYWGDPDTLRSNDWRASIYWTGNAASLSFDYEYRDFDFTIPSVDFLTAREISFNATGLGGSARFQTSENTSLSLSGMKFDYSVPFRPIENQDAANFLSATRLSLINTIVDHRAHIALSIDQGDKNWTIDLSTWEGKIDRSRTNSLTVQFLLPMTRRSDIEFGLGYDENDLYGDVTFFSLYVYFYGGN